MNLRPVGDKVILLPDAPLDKTDSGIHLPSVLSKEGRTETGVVVEVGPGALSDDDGTRTPPGVKRWQRVLFKRVSGSDYTQGPFKYHILPAREILGVIEENPSCPCPSIG